ncbi:MAG: efflux RND transporter periplasmic adaptor subunit [Candidatus Cloacimonadaceae bacterium]|jgi:RND family efflux transporter MFP subunit|nr:efflux RND transporter periplasmic adaptor subunit [Candidatus Cloacimonadota bacterium]MDD4815345.1 efflux RND transporter periplasmic adaptor subunit [Candidatus Cloacimonadota bacterium]MDY0381641.1 efflux RND transporter periplasmic adaptor subunit [Candidatus Cloacimonadaceae bacterium]
MKKRTTYLIVAMSLIMLLSACGKKEQDAKSMEQLHEELGIPVRVSQIESDTFVQQLIYNATLQGMQESTVQAMLGDVVTGIKAKVGDRVEKGDVIVTFPVNSPSAQYEQARTAFNSINTTHDRMQRLHEQGAISVQDYENVRTQWEVAKANLESSEQMVFVKAPIGGVITDIMVNVSEKVFPGTDLFTVSSTNGYKATIMVPENEISRIKKGGTVKATWNDIVITGRISEIAMALDPFSKAFRVEAQFPGYRPALGFGVTAEIGIQTLSKPNVFIVDRNNLVRENGDDFVWLAREDKATKVPVTTGVTDQLRYEISEGLQAGDMLIIEGIKSLSEGAKIRIIEGN